MPSARSIQVMPKLHTSVEQGSRSGKSAMIRSRALSRVTTEASARKSVRMLNMRSGTSPRVFSSSLIVPKSATRGDGSTFDEATDTLECDDAVVGEYNGWNATRALKN